MNNRSASVVTLGVLMLGGAQAQPAPPTDAPPTAVMLTAEPVFARPPAAATENSLVAFGAGAQSSQLGERLADPAQRALLRAEQRSSLEQSHAGVGRVLGINAATEAALIELLTDQQMERMDSFNSRMGGRPAGGESMVHAEAARQTRRIEQLRALLGESRLEQYQAFDRTLGERSQIRTLDARLDAAYKLTPAQMERLIPVYQANNARSRDLSRTRISSQSLLPPPILATPSREELQRHSLLQNISVNESLWRAMPNEHRFVTEAAAPILTEQQLAALTQLHSEQENQLQQRIERMRVQAGLSAHIPAPTESEENRAPRIDGDRDVKISIRLSIDRSEPKTFSQVVRNGRPATFDAGGGLQVDATPTLYSDGMFDLQIAYYEQSSSGRRLIGEMGTGGALTNQSGIVDLTRSGGSASVLVGRKGYAVEFDTRVEAI
jgi:hypothetical protein